MDKIAISTKDEKLVLRVNVTTWAKDSHSLYDYESPKISERIFEFPVLSKPVCFYRQRNSTKVSAFESDNKAPDLEPEVFELMMCARLQRQKSSGKIRLELNKNKSKGQKIASERQKTNESIESLTQTEELPYYIVNKLFANGKPSGYRLMPGMTIRLGRIEYYVSEYRTGANCERIIKKKQRNPLYFNTNVMSYVPAVRDAQTPSQNVPCKICLDDTDDPDNFLFNPCKCLGSCGTVHFECLKKWIHVKVKKQIIGGTMHYNFQRFQCEICMTDIPGYIEKDGVAREILELERPTDNYIVLEGACEKQKSVMIIQNTPNEGIKLGRGHQCEIRITDISVSRKHAVIRCINNEFYIFDNKSKFGTLVREESMAFQLKKERKPVQVGRSIFEFELVRTD